MCVHIRRDMATKTISIMEDVYEMLTANKLENESFSEEIRRILSKKGSRPLQEFFGVLSETEGDYIIQKLESKRAMELELKKKRYTV